jgi:group I intron endonuclease
MATGIYIIKNKVTGDSYVGSASVCFKSRWRHHNRDLRINKHHSSRLQNSWNKYGADSFEFSILEECGPEVCIAREQFYLDTLRPVFNMNPTAGNCLGRKFSEESKKKMSLSAKKRKLPEALILNQKSKAEFDEIGNKKCNKCLEFKEPKVFAKKSCVCKKCRQSLVKSKAVPGAREKYAQSLSIGKIIAKNSTTVMEFRSLRDVERNFSIKKVNKTTIKRYLNTQKEYLGFKWELLSA